MVNVTIMVRNRFNLTKQCLESLAASGMDGMTVTIQDDRSEAETTDWVIKWCFDHGAYYFRNDTPMGTGPLRNNVIRESVKHYGKGEYLAPHDNDTHFSPDWLAKMIQCYKLLKSSDVRLITGCGHPYHRPVREFNIGNGFSAHIVQAVPTQSQFMEWSTYDLIGEFCETPIDRTCQSEDVDWERRLVAHGYAMAEIRPHLIHATALKNTFGEPGPGWEYVKAEVPEGVICE